MKPTMQMTLECVGCKEKNTIKCEVPGYMELKVKKFDCVGCGSGVMVKYERARNGKLNQIKLDMKLTRVSEKLKAFLRVALDKQLELGKKLQDLKEKEASSEL